MYVRFVVAKIDPDSAVRQGLFQAADALRRSGALSIHEAALLTSIEKWFDTNLVKPKRLRRSRLPHRQAKAISWFKSSAGQHIAQIRAIALILESHGRMVDMIKTRRPGYIVYEDEFQIAAEPFSDTAT
jgi:hypothetical protein